MGCCLLCVIASIAFLKALDVGTQYRRTLKDWRIDGLALLLEEISAGGATVGFFYELSARTADDQDVVLLIRFQNRMHSAPEDSIRFEVLAQRLVINVNCRLSYRQIRAVRIGDQLVEVRTHLSQ